MNKAAQERSGGQHDGGAGDAAPIRQDNSGNPLIFYGNIICIAFDHLQVRMFEDFPLHGKPIELPVSLGAGAAHSGSLPPVQHPELDTGRIGNSAHQPVESIDFPDEVALAEAANGGIAGHHPDRLALVGNQGRPSANTRCSAGRLAAGMAATYHDDIKSITHCLHRRGACFT
jgi:hypothetical protein